ncbi:tyrosine-protein phosphatase [Pseudomonas sp. GD03721]|nr:MULTISPECIES: tyrosine-protein phosphatase [unclassified Pseudomonas]MDH1440352.1 tyrosine-protein phosphatase [Pseudomonas sp. GD03722]WGG03558.1 tyrosine-protein phosphatase [Pseudomonas sp. GD03721]WGG07726.1 tyrosine-protein phosphatase [Pseudomonas sp. GD03919]
MGLALLDTPSKQDATQAMLLSYHQFPAAVAPRLTPLFDRLLASDGLLLVFHCVAGKDRTGFVAAILLSTLGISWEQVLKDYLLTAKHWHGPRSKELLSPKRLRGTAPATPSNSQTLQVLLPPKVYC